MNANGVRRKTLWTTNLGVTLTVAAGCASPFNSLPVADARNTPGLAVIEQRLVLIGDAGSARAAPVLRALADTVGNLPQVTTVVFLGDNVYPDGIPGGAHRSRRAAEEVLSRQVESVTRGGARAVFITGNHDWHHGREGIMAQAELIARFGTDASGLHRASLLPEPPGCPGPASIALGQRVLLAAVDTEWLLMEEGKRAEASCPHRTPEDVEVALRALLEGNTAPDVVVVGHHPLRTRGRHGGKCGLLCLRQLGSIVIGSPQDMRHPRNAEMRRLMARALETTRPLVYAAGHEHSLQVFEGTSGSEAQYFLVSGRGSPDKQSEIGHASNSLYAREVPGFMILDFVRGGGVVLRVVETEAGRAFVHELH